MSISEWWQILSEAADRVEELEAALREIAERDDYFERRGILIRTLEGK